MPESKIIITHVNGTAVLEIINMSGKDACFHLIMALEKLAHQLSEQIDQEDKEAIQRWVDIAKGDNGNRNTDTTIN